jgi:hypothetical protein
MQKLLHQKLLSFSMLFCQAIPKNCFWCHGILQPQSAPKVDILTNRQIWLFHRGRNNTSTFSELSKHFACQNSKHWSSLTYCLNMVGIPSLLNVSQNIKSMYPDQNTLILYLLNFFTYFISISYFQFPIFPFSHFPIFSVSHFPILQTKQTS